MAAKMAAKVENSEDDSFIILGTSPGTSLDLKCNGVENGVALDKKQIEDAMKDLSTEANLAFKAQFQLGDCPSVPSMMIASTIITEDKSTEDIQKKFGELLDENVMLKETLKQNNDSMKEQFMLIASCQEDMMRTHMIHKEKFEETRELVERLRQENKKLKVDIARLVDGEGKASVNGETGENSKSGPSSAIELVTSPDDDTLDKLTTQLALVEKQRRQVITENEKLTWQKESLEHIVDATSKERDDLKEKLKNVELQLSNNISDHAMELERLNYNIQELQAKIMTTSVSSEEIMRRDAIVRQLESKILSLQGDLKNAQLRILDLENVKLEYSKHKSGVSDIVKIYKDQIQDLHNKLKEASTTVFQPVRCSMSSDMDSSSSEFSSLNSGVKMYDRTLKHLSDLLNILTHGISDSLVETLGVIISLQEYKLDRSSAEQFKSSLNNVKQMLETQHSSVLTNIGQVRGIMSILEGIFKECSDSLGKPKKETPNVEALTAALVARGQELQSLQAELDRLRAQREDHELMAAQIELYKSDFEAERQCREKMAAEKETISVDLRKTQRRNQELVQQMDEVRRINPAVYRSATSRRPQGSAPSTPARQSSAPSTTASNTSTGNRVAKKKKLTHEEDETREPTPPPIRFDCPVCDQPFKTLILLQHHVEHCIPQD